MGLIDVKLLCKKIVKDLRSKDRYRNVMGILAILEFPLLLIPALAGKIDWKASK